MVINPFILSPTPHIVFGAGKIGELSNHILNFGDTVLIVTGYSSLKSRGKLEEITDALSSNSIRHRVVRVKGEPSPELIDEYVLHHKNRGIDAVVSIGGGSVIDTGKAISAMLGVNEPVITYLEGVGSGRIHSGIKVPFIAVPTTAGTGSEATKNAVLSRTGRDGFKKSLRHNNFIPDIALIDPELAVGCPRNITAASGLDAFTQLLGSFVSTKASPLTDALALNGLEMIGRCLIPVCGSGSSNVNLRSGMAYAAMLSGITLANAGLGIVHGLASLIGGYFDVPHGIICGTLVGEALKLNIECLKKDNSRGILEKYAMAGSLITGTTDADIEKNCDLLIKTVNRWIDELEIPRLGSYGIKEDDIDLFTDVNANKNNPVHLDMDQISGLVISRL